MAVTRLRRAAVAARRTHRKGSVIEWASARNTRSPRRRSVRIIHRRFGVGFHFVLVGCISDDCLVYEGSQRNLVSRLVMRHLNQEIRNRGNGISEIEGKAAMPAASKAGAERVSMERMGCDIESLPIEITN